MSEICCFSGHREIKQDQIKEVYRLLEQSITYCIEKGCVDYRAGGAMGFDTFAALTVLKLKIRYPQIKLHLVLPCKNQDACWSKQDKDLYRFIIGRADSVRYVSEKYYPGVMYKRNRALADGSSLCIVYLEKRSGGTAYTASYAKGKGVRVINLREKMQPTNIRPA